MSYGNVIKSSVWHTLIFLSHPDEIANFDFSHYAVALQRFRRKEHILTQCFLHLSKIYIYIYIRGGGGGSVLMKQAFINKDMHGWFTVRLPRVMAFMCNII